MIDRIPFKLKKRPNPSGLVVMVVSFLALFSAFLVASVIFWAYGTNPIHAYTVLFDGMFGGTNELATTVRRAIPFLLAGVGLALAFKARFWNIGAEGQLLLGTVAASWVALFSPVPPPLLIPAMFFFGFLAGAMWGLVPAILKSKLGVNEVITTLMMNYIAINLVQFLVQGPWKGESQWGFPYTDMYPPQARLATLGNTNVHWLTLILGVVAAMLAYFFVQNTTPGYEIKVIGRSPSAAKFAGMSKVKTTLLVMFISGGLAGMAGVGEVAGIHHMLRGPNQISLGYGYTAIIVAWLARNNPLAVIITSFFFGAILAGGNAIKVSLGLPFQIIDVFNGLILFFLIGSEILMSYKLTWRNQND
ncbi:ABC transporter permease [Candidatus Bipolaricaulota bacterium]|nr:ABC transporter permease [Candidatus Bipolaricaulota bacterium]MBS3793237.1 ABC transporter permease [Candidatus Bipolaricaulota bacterium]